MKEPQASVSPPYSSPGPSCTVGRWKMLRTGMALETKEEGLKLQG